MMNQIVKWLRLRWLRLAVPRALLVLVACDAAAIAPLMALTMVPVAGVTAIGVEQGEWYYFQRSMQNAADAAVIAAAFATKRYALLKGAFGDRLHQPHRAKLVPFLGKVIEAGEEAGALGGWLSGSGSTICCLAPDARRAAAIAANMKRHAPKGSKTVIVAADNHGAKVIKAV